MLRFPLRDFLPELRLLLRRQHRHDLLPTLFSLRRVLHDLFDLRLLGIG